MLAPKLPHTNIWCVCNLRTNCCARRYVFAYKVCITYVYYVFAIRTLLLFFVVSSCHIILFAVTFSRALVERNNTYYRNRAWITIKYVAVLFAFRRVFVFGLVPMYRTLHGFHTKTPAPYELPITGPSVILLAKNN